MGRYSVGVCVGGLVWLGVGVGVAQTSCMLPQRAQRAVAQPTNNALPRRQHTDSPGCCQVHVDTFHQTPAAPCTGARTHQSAAAAVSLRSGVSLTCELHQVRAPRRCGREYGFRLVNRPVGGADQDDKEGKTPGSVGRDASGSTTQASYPSAKAPQTTRGWSSTARRRIAWVTTAWH
jgi:hypothetical protein